MVALYPEVFISTNAVSFIFIILTDISSHPWALLGLSDCMILSIFSSEITKLSIGVEVKGVCSGKNGVYTNRSLL